MTENAKPHLTHATGAPVSDNLNIQTAGPRGPALLQEASILRSCSDAWTGSLKP